jgi:hypothetical protein
LESLQIFKLGSQCVYAAKSSSICTLHKDKIVNLGKLQAKCKFRREFFIKWS